MDEFNLGLSNKSIQQQGEEFMPGTAGLQIQCPNHQAMLPPMMYSACNALTVDCLEQLKDVDIIKIKEKQKVNDIT